MYLKPTLILLKVYAFHHYIHVSGIDNVNKFAKVIKSVFVSINVYILYIIIILLKFNIQTQVSIVLENLRSFLFL